MEWKYYKIDKSIEICDIITAFDVTREKAFTFPGEMHNFWEIVQIVDGQVTVTADDRIYNLDKNSVIFHKPMEFHKLSAIGNCMPRLRIISFTANGELINMFNNLCTTFNAEQSYMFSDIVNQAAKWLDDCEVCSSADLQLRSQIVANKLENFLIELKLSEFQPTVQGSLTALELNFQNILRVIHEHYEEDLNLDTIAQLCNMSVSNMKKIFHLFYDQGVMNYVRNLKIRKATQLLKSDLTICQISDRLGFDNQNYFSQVFKKYTGLSPREYRNKILK